MAISGQGNGCQRSGKWLSAMSVGTQREGTRPSPTGIVCAEGGYKTLPYGYLARAEVAGKEETGP